MATYNFANLYKFAGLQPTSEIIQLRKQSGDKILTNLNFKRILDLIRLYFTLPVPDGIDWFVDAFSEDDASFSTVDNEREIAVLSACILADALENENEGEFICLAMVVMSTVSFRNPSFCSDFLNHVIKKLPTYSVSERKELRNYDAVKIPNKTKFTTSINEYKTNGDHTKGAEAILYTYADATEMLKSVANELSSLSQPLISQVRDLREEVDMLWWYIGGYSKVLNKPFSDLDLGLAAILAGLDLAELSQSYTGPVAAPAILHRVITHTREENKNLVLSDVVDSLHQDLFSRLVLPENLPNYYDFCPILTALFKYKENGSGEWMGAFRRLTNLDSKIEFTPIDFAIQIYRESLLLAWLD